MHTKLTAVFIAAAGCLAGCGGSSSDNSAVGNADVQALFASAGSSLGMNAHDYQAKIVSAQYPANWHVFFPSTLAIDFKNQLVTMPMYQGSSPKGTEYYIITEASDFQTAKNLGVNYAPKLVKAPAAAVQNVTFDASNHLVFEGTVDFSPVRALGITNVTSNATALAQLIMPVPGANGDSKYSPLIKLPSGVVLNISYVSNATGDHDHIVAGGGSVDKTKMTATLGFLDGFEGGNQYFYHLVLDTNAAGPSAIEGGTYAPRLAAITTFGQDLPTDNSPLLGFSPVGNGQAAGNAQQQGLNSLIYNYALQVQARQQPTFKPDPINVFPLQPVNGVENSVNNYSPLWDAHISSWNNPASAVRIRGLDQLQQLITAGQVTSFGTGTTAGDLIPLVPNGLIIDCPVIAQPDASVISAL